MEFEWDESNLRHLARHRISRAEFEEAMANDPILVDFNDESGEDRWYALGATNGLRVLFMVFTHRAERVRPITAWSAGRALREAYFRRKGT
ncbi:MAG TPA: BrnT family toxin [Terriglobia bacterium]|nr:BrnT family toxin [Terriglobia bacterium]